MKKSQVTVIVIIGIVLLIVLGVVLLKTKPQSKEIKSDYETSEILERQAEQIEYYVEQCLVDISTPALFNKIALQGGYIDPEYNEKYGLYDNVPFLTSGYVKIPYWYHNGNDISPTKNDIEKNFGRYVAVEAINCTNFEDFEFLHGTEITRPKTNYKDTNFVSADSHIDVEINDEDVVINYNFPLTLERKNNQKIIENFQIEIPVALGNDLKIGKEILKNMIQNPTGYNIQEDCGKYNRKGYTNVYHFNNRIMLHDYETFMDRDFQRTFTIQFLYSGLNIYGYCSG